MVGEGKGTPTYRVPSNKSSIGKGLSTEKWDGVRAGGKTTANACRGEGRTAKARNPKGKKKTTKGKVRSSWGAYVLGIWHEQGKKDSAARGQLEAVLSEYVRACKKGLLVSPGEGKDRARGLKEGAEGMVHCPRLEQASGHP